MMFFSFFVCFVFEFLFYSTDESPPPLPIDFSGLIVCSDFGKSKIFGFILCFKTFTYLERGEGGRGNLY